MGLSYQKFKSLSPNFIADIKSHCESNFSCTIIIENSHTDDEESKADDYLLKIVGFKHVEATSEVKMLLDKALDFRIPPEWDYTIQTLNSKQPIIRQVTKGS